MPILLSDSICRILGLAFFPFPAFQIVQGTKYQMVKQNPAQSQKKFNYPLLKSRAHKVQIEKPPLKLFLQGISGKAPLLLDAELILPGQPADGLEN